MRRALRYATSASRRRPACWYAYPRLFHALAFHGDFRTVSSHNATSLRYAAFRDTVSLPRATTSTAATARDPPRAPLPPQEIRPLRHGQEEPPGGEVQLAFVRHVEAGDEGVRRNEMQKEPEDPEPRHGPFLQPEDPGGKERRKEKGLRNQDRRSPGEDGQVGIDVQGVGHHETRQKIPDPVDLREQVGRRARMSKHASSSRPYPVWERKRTARNRRSAQ